MKIPLPDSLEREHQELHAELRRAIESGGRVGDAAKAVAEKMHPHFVREEEIAMPPLALLAELASHEPTREMADVVALTDDLERELPQMLEQHAEIVSALQRLDEAANLEGKNEFARFAEKLVSHARTEEEILYPAAILVGRYVKLKLGL